MLPAAPAPEIQKPPMPSARFRILVADDDTANRESMAKLLGDRGFQTITAKDGAEAVQIVQGQVIHLAIFDMHMPRLTGLEALHVVRQLNAVLPAILMTADATRQLLQQALQAQVYSVIPKPVNANVVLETLKRALSQVYPQQPPERTFCEREIPFV